MEISRLKVGDSGDNVTYLHTVLQLQNLEISTDECRRKFFGPSTREAVREFQTSHNIIPSGEVCEQTVILLTRQSASRLSSQPEVTLSSTVSSSPNSRDIAQRIQQRDRLEVIEEWNQPGNLIGQVVQLSDPRIVKGQITLADGKPCAFATIRAYAKSLRQEDLLNETITNHEGIYEIEYRILQEPGRITESIDLIVRVYDRDDCDRTHQPPICFNAGIEETIDLTVTKDYHGLSEYEQLTTAVQNFSGVVNFASLHQDQAQQDLAFIAGKTNCDRQHLALLGQATELEEQTGLPAEVLYGILRHNLNTQGDPLAQRPKALLQALEGAAQQQIISPQWLEDQEITSRVKQLAVEHTFTNENDPAAPIATVIRTVLDSDPEQQRNFFAHYLQYEGTLDTFLDKEDWRSLVSNEQADDLEFALRAVALVPDRPVMAKAVLQLRRHANLRDGDRIRSLRDLAGRKSVEIKQQLAVANNGATSPDASPRTRDINSFLRAVDLRYPTDATARRLVNNSDAPTELSSFFSTYLNNGFSFDLRTTPIRPFLHDQAETLGNRSKEQHLNLIRELEPRQRLLRLTGNPSHMELLHQEGLTSSAQIARFGRNAFIRSYSNKLGVEAAALVYDRAQQTAAAAQALLAEFHPSFNQIGLHVLPLRKLAELKKIPNWEELFGSLDLCDCPEYRTVLSPAAYLVDILHFLAQLSKTNDKAPLGVLLDRRPDLVEIEFAQENTFTTLPYIDLVNEVLEQKVSPFQITIANASGNVDSFVMELDAGEILPALKYELTIQGIPVSENAKILVDEKGKQWRISDTSWHLIIELVVDGLNPNKLCIQPFPQTGSSIQELNACPEHVNTSAYTKLRDQVYPWNLPLDAWLEEVRIYLAQLGVTRHTLMRTLRPQEDIALAAEYLGMSMVEWSTIAGNVLNLQYGVCEFWGFRPGTSDFAIELKPVRNFMARTGLTFKQGEQLLTHRYIDPRGILEVEIDDATNEQTNTDPTLGATCDTNRLEVKNLDERACDRIHRFLRLQKRLGWTFQELDQAICALIEISLTPEIIQGLQNLHDAFSELFVVQPTPGDIQEILDISIRLTNKTTTLRNHQTLTPDLKDAIHVFHGEINKATPVNINFARLFDLLKLARRLHWQLIQVKNCPAVLRDRLTELIGSLPDDLVAFNQKVLSVLTGMGLNEEYLPVLFDCSVAVANLLQLRQSLQLGFLINLARSLNSISRFPVTDQLWEKLSGAVSNLKATIFTAVEAATPNNRLLVEIAHIQQIHDEYKVPISSLISWHAPLDTYRYGGDDRKFLASFYDRIFLNPSATQLRPGETSRFQLNTLRTEVKHRHVSLAGSESMSGLASALGISVEEVDLLLNGRTLSINGQPVFITPRIPTDDKRHTLSNLSLLYRYVSLARSLQLKIHDLLRIKALSGVDPFTGEEATTPRTRQTLKFMDLVKQIRKSGFSLDDLDYLLRNLASTAAPTTPQIAQTLTSLQTGLKQIYAETELPKQITEELLVQQLTALFDRDLVDSSIRWLAWDQQRLNGVLNSFENTIFESEKLTNPPTIFSDHQTTPDLPWYDKNSKKLCFKGVMTPSTMRAFLDTPEVAQDSKLKAAIVQLFDASRQLTVQRLLELGAPFAERDLTTPQAWPDELKHRIVYDTALHKLRIFGALSQADLQALNTCPADETYCQAIQALFDQPRQFIAGSLRAFEMPMFTTKLTQKPEAIAFPKELQRQIYYDPINTNLCFIGIMTERIRSSLQMLLTEDQKASPSGQAYLTAIDQLFDNSRQLLQNPQSKTIAPENEFLGLADAAQLLNHPATSAADRFAFVLGKYLSHARGVASDRFVTQKIAEILKLDAEVAHDVLTKWVTCPDDAKQRAIDVFLTPAFVESDPRIPLQESVFGAQFKTFRRLHKTALLLNHFKATPLQLTWLFKYGPEVVWLDPRQLSIDPNVAETPTKSASYFALWARLVDLFQLRDGLPQGEKLLDDLLGLARTPGKVEADMVQLLSDRTGWSQADLSTFIGVQGFNLHFPGACFDERGLRLLKDGFDLMRKLGVSAAQCLAWSKTGLTYEDSLTLEDARTARQAIKAHYGEQWLDTLKPLSDAIRERRRSALAAYLIAHTYEQGQQKWKDTNDLYAHFLIDVEMSSAVPTSRIKQACASVQLFVQRCLLNLEADVSANAEDDEKWQEWKWMKNYRVWEANRKIFLFPENWIEPELRDDKSPFFKELENELLQGEITNETAEDTLRHYLEKLAQVARLEICGLVHQVEEDANSPLDVLHVLARTPNTPHLYFYRRRIMPKGCSPYSSSVEAYWTAWERVDVDIEGDNIRLVVWNRRLCIFWLTFREKAEDQPLQLKQDTTVPAPPKFWEIQLAWSEYSNGRWLPKQLSGDDTCVKDLNLLPKYLFEFWVRFDQSSNNLYLIPSPARDLSCFKLVDLNESPNLIPTVKLAANGVRTGVEVADTKKVFRPHAEFTGQSFFGGFYTTNSQNPQMGIYWTNDQGAQPGYSILENFKERLYIHDTDQNYLNFSCADSRHTFLVNYLSQNLNWGIFEFQLFYHPYARVLIRHLNKHGIAALLDRETQINPNTLLPIGVEQLNFETYATFVSSPRSGVINSKPGSPLYPCEDIDFDPAGTYSAYNWELFFHIPLLIADRLYKNQRFEEAMKWFHYIFNPTDASQEETPKRYWQTKPFFKRETEEYVKEQIENLLKQIAGGGSNELTNAIRQWRENPFKPHLVARTRTTAYQKTVVMKYLDNLIAWADQLFRRDTIESINEATQLYVLAAEILGRRPELIPPRYTPQPQTYNRLAAKSEISTGLNNDDFSDPLVLAEHLVSEENTGIVGTQPPAVQLAQMLVFGVPKNDRLWSYWDTVANRLFNIRYGLNIEGVARPLALFEPPIDPALLVRAAAAGIDLGNVLSEAAAPMPHYRFNIMAQKAAELCAEVKSLGAALLSALEKRDAEELARLRSSHEIDVLKAVRTVKEKQIEEAEDTLTGLQKSREVIDIRHQYYSSRPYMNAGEIAHISGMNDALSLRTVATVATLIAGILHLIPDLKLGAPTTLGTSYGGTNLGEFSNFYSASLRDIAALIESGASIAATLGNYDRRKDDWEHQANLAKKELEQVDKQITAAEIRRDIAKQELQNHDLQVSNAEKIDATMRDKFTNQELYSWMVGQIASVYFQSYQLAFDVAKRAERAFRFELGLQDSNYIQFGYWDSLKKGLLAGERLTYDLKRMEVAYLEQNRREYELTKHISLKLHNPLALIALKETGRCEIDLPEVLFDADYPGHYRRRIKSVSLTIPCITGPYTSINCTLTLLTNKIRINNNAQTNYAEDLQTSDSRFVTNFAATQSIATSTAQNDSGMFEVNFRDERYLPFEGAGAISRWRIDMPKDCNAFDFDTISDVILKLNYTAREGGEPLKIAAKKEMKAAISDAAKLPLARLFSAKHEFPTEWHQFLQSTSTPAKLNLNFSVERFPYQFRGKKIVIQKVELFLPLKEGKKPDSDKTYTQIYAEAPLVISLKSNNGTANEKSLDSSPAFLNGTPHIMVEDAAVPNEVKSGIDANWSLTIDELEKFKQIQEAFTDLIIICHYSVILE